MRGEIILTTLIITLFSIQFTIASITVEGGGNSFENVINGTTKTYKIEIYNEETNNTKNITNVGIKLPTGFTYEEGQGNDAGGNFSNNGNYLNWTNDGMIMNQTKAEFWFDAKATITKGMYGFKITTKNANEKLEEKNLTIKVYDLIPPKVKIESPKTQIYETEWILLNITINEEGECYFSKDSGTNNNTMNSLKDKIFYETQSFVGKNTINFYCKDKDGNWNNSMSVSFQVSFEEGGNEENVQETKTTINDTLNKTKKENKENNSSKKNIEQNVSIKENSPKETIGETNNQAEGVSVLKWIIIIPLVIIGLILVFYVVSKLKAPYEQ